MVSLAHKIGLGIAGKAVNGPSTTSPPSRGEGCGLYSIRMRNAPLYSSYPTIWVVLMLKRKELSLEVSTSPIENIKAFRLIAESENWSMTTHEGSRLVDRFAIIIPMAQSARTLGIEIMDGPLQGLELHSWAETKGSAGAINIAAWTIPGGHGNEEARDVIRKWARSLSRCPWKWSFGERSRIGYLLPVFRRSRKAFAKLGLTKWEKK